MPSTYVGSGRARTPARPRMNAELLTSLATRLTTRDRWLLELLHEHRVLTTHQIHELAFPSISTTTHRMAALWRLRAVERFRPATEVGSAPMHYVLGPAGAAVLAARRNQTPTEFGYRTDVALRLAHSDKTAHLVGSNAIFTALAAHARTHPETELVAWWSERRCRKTWGHIVRPDGYGRWRHHNREVDFFTEYDTGTEPLHRLLTKIENYRRLSDHTQITTPVLFILPSTVREDHLHTRLTTTAAAVATTTCYALAELGGPAGPVWRPVGKPARCLLTDLTAAREGR
jgi:hypothetical protein